MTNEEAIKELKEDRALYEGDIVEAGDGTPDGQLLLALDMAIEALEKQIPRKPVEQGDGINYNCPACGRYVGYFDAMAWEMPKYCDACGQAIDWSSGEDD